MWKLNKKQKESQSLIDKHKYSLLIGSGRSGKTMVIIVEMFRRAISHPNTNHAIFRNTLSSCIDGVWKITIREVIENFFPVLPLMEGFSLNESRHEVTFPNGSRIVLRGLDTKERAQKVLSTQFATVFFDEAHLIDYQHYGLLMTRMPQPLGVDYKVKIICAANWASKTSWLKKFFVEKINPETNSLHGQDVGMITSTTYDNHAVDAKEYLTTLEQAGDRRSRLMCAGTGFYDEVIGALWTQEDIIRGVCPDELDEIVIAFDPSLTNNSNSDEHGVAIAARKDENFFLLYCLEEQCDVNDFAKKVCQLYHNWDCDRLVYETNAGGDWIESLIRNHDPKVFCQKVRAKRGKMLRAEPVAALYKSGKVFHCDTFTELEDQMLTFSGTGDSPNALDAMVYAIRHLSDTEPLYVNPHSI